MKKENSYKWSGIKNCPPNGTMVVSRADVFRSLCLSALAMRETDVKRLLRDLDKGIIKANYFGASKLEVNL